jgi:hypothetical protein
MSRSWVCGRIFEHAIHHPYRVVLAVPGLSWLESDAPDGEKEDGLRRRLQVPIKKGDLHLLLILIPVLSFSFFAGLREGIGTMC